MSEIQPVPVEQIYRQIVDFCISEKAEIEPGASVSLEMLPTGQHTRIDGARIEAGAIIESLVWLQDGVLVCKDAAVLYGATVGEDAKIGIGATVGFKAVLGSGVDVAPDVSIGNFARAGENVRYSIGADIGAWSFVGPGLYVHGDIGRGVSIHMALRESN